MASVRKKLTVVGDVACGKTCLLLAFCKEQFPKCYQPTVFEIYTTDTEVDGQPMKLMLFDAAGQRQGNLQHFCSLFYEGTNVILMCFSVDMPKSLQNILDIWIPEVKLFCPIAPIVLVATKKELRKDQGVLERLSKLKQNPVKIAEGKALADSIGVYSYLECSAKTKDVTKRVLHVIGQAALHDGKKKRRNHCMFCIL